MDSHDERIANHAGDERKLGRRIEDMESRLAVERAQVSAHARAFGGKVRRRMTSPTSLLFAGSMGFIAAELIRARSAAVQAAQRQGRSRQQQKAAGKSVFGMLSKPLMALLHLGSMGFLVKKNKDVADTVQSEVAATPSMYEDETRVLH